uniref:Putative ovule protein n=1 Tax=Solanum chacoense TaxID=4108 RepID=A0A0V0H5D1_SOLCH
MIIFFCLNCSGHRSSILRFFPCITFKTGYTSSSVNHPQYNSFSSTNGITSSFFFFYDKGNTQPTTL